MPLFAFACGDCAEVFETFVMSGETAACPACASERLEQQLSLIATPKRGSGGRRGRVSGNGGGGGCAMA